MAKAIKVRQGGAGGPSYGVLHPAPDHPFQRSARLKKAATNYIIGNKLADFRKPIIGSCTPPLMDYRFYCGEGEQLLASLRLLYAF